MISTIVRKLAYRFDIQISRRTSLPPDFSRSDAELVECVRPFTMTSPERILALSNAVEWVVKEQIQGAFVECGVWRGGSMMVVARTLAKMGVLDRDLYLFDTYAGMSEPTAEDRDLSGRLALPQFEKYISSSVEASWCYADIDDVRRNVASTGYPDDSIHFVKGMVQVTVPEAAPERIALLRLDTDWYESTKHELENLWPRLQPRGVCIVDDYGHWRGSRKAVDEYFASIGLNVMMHRIDYTGRLIVKP